MLLGKAIMHINPATIKCSATKSQASQMPEDSTL